MRERAKHWWDRVPVNIRKPLVLVIGSFFILASAATGWLPGPGGIPLFLIGVAILATEFVWAERFRDKILVVVHYLGNQWKAHKIIGAIVATICAGSSLAIAYMSFTHLH
ncbi:MAG TPA: PGPGW domain-containing protein [Candidatus Saccharimonadales bacterium]